MSLDFGFGYADTHEHAGRAAEYRELANRCIEDAMRCLLYAEAWASRLPLLDESLRGTVTHAVFKHRRDTARTHHHQLENDIDWFLSPTGYSLWVCATRLSEEEAESVRDEYLRRAEPLYEAYYQALYAVRPRVYR